jgi:tetratricopeptide (TPR) repeat protein
LVVAVGLAYGPSLPGGFLNWDDPWLVRDNPVLREDAAEALRAIWLDFSDPTRMALGAEYLPVRDLSVWLEAEIHGLLPQAMRTANLLFYLAALLLLRRALRAALGPGLAAEIAVWLFALHPVHVESVAWIASRKDVLALLMVAAALATYAGASRHRVWQVPGLLAFAHLSKAVTVTAFALLIAHDLLARRRPELRVLVAAVVVALAATALHFAVGGIVGMAAEPHGGGRLETAAMMGGVWVRYGGMLLWPSSLSAVYVVEPSSWVAGLGHLLLLGWGLAGILLLRRGRPLGLASWLWFAASLVPVSQVLVPLQNVMADRYLLLAALAPCLLAAHALTRTGRLGLPLALTAALALGFATFERALAFSDSVFLWTDALEKTPGSPLPPYQLAKAKEEDGDPRAVALYELALTRGPESHDVARSATTNLSRMYTERGDLARAEWVLRRGLALWPDDPKLWNNLAEVLARRGAHAEARALFDELVRRFPGYQRGVDNYRKRYGPGPPP